MSMLHIDVRLGESIQIGDATVTLEKKTGRMARLKIDADKSIKITRPSAGDSAQECAPKLTEHTNHG